MDQTRSPWILGLGAIALTAGCAQVPLAKMEPTSAGAKVAPVYRVQQPAGTAAGQYAVGRIDLAEGRVDAAITRFRNALQLDRGFVEAHNGLGVAYGQQGRFAEAAEAFRAALVLAPDAPHVLNNLGFAQLKAGQLDEAWVSLKRSLALDSRNERTRENIDLLASARTAVVAAAAASAAPAAPAPVAASVAVAAQAPVIESAPVSAPIAESQPVAAPIVASLPAAAPAQVAAQLAAPAPLAARVQDTAFPAAEPLPAAAAVRTPSAPAPVVAAVVKPVPAPSVDPARPAYEIVVARSNESALVQVAPNVYELRSGPASVATTAAARAATVAAPAPTVVAAPTLPLAVPMVTAQNDVPRRVQPAKRPATTLPLAALDGIEVSNGVGIRHLAGRTARTLSGLGVTVARVSDYRLFGRQRTEIHYRNGHVGEAMAVRRTLPVGARLVQSSRLHPQVNVRLVIGKDLVERQVAWLGSEGMTADAEPEALSYAKAETVQRGIDLQALTARLSRADVNAGWRLL